MFGAEFLLIFAALLLLTAFCGCDSESPTSPVGLEMDRYYPDELGFSISFPREWEILEERPKIVATSPEEGPGDRFHEDVIVGIDLLPTLTLEGYLQQFLEGMEKLLPDFRHFDHGQASIGGYNAKWIVFSYRRGAVRVKALMYFLMERYSKSKINNVYLIMGTSTPEQFTVYRNTFEHIAESLRFHPYGFSHKSEEEERAEFFVKQLEDTYVYDRIHAAEELWRLMSELQASQEASTPSDSSAFEIVLPALIEALNDELKEVRYYACLGLEAIGDSFAVPALIHTLSDESADIRRQAAQALGSIGDPTAVPALAALLKDEDAGVRETAAGALTIIGTLEAMKAVEEFEKEKQEEV